MQTGDFLQFSLTSITFFSIYNVYSSGSFSQNLVSLQSCFYGVVHPSAMYHLLPRITMEVSLP